MRGRLAMSTAGQQSANLILSSYRAADRHMWGPLLQMNQHYLSARKSLCWIPEPHSLR
jgi:hypothetical protein